MGVLCQRPQIPHTEVARSGGEDIAESQGAQRGVSPGTAAVNQERLRIRSTAPSEEERGVDAVVEIDHAPGALETFTIRAPVPGATAVIDVHNGKPSARPVLDRIVQRGTATRGWPAVARHDEWGCFTLGPIEVTISGGVVERVRRQSILGRELNGLGHRQIRRVEGIHETRRENRLSTASEVDAHHRTGLVRGGNKAYEVDAVGGDRTDDGPVDGYLAHAC